MTTAVLLVFLSLPFSVRELDVVTADGPVAAWVVRVDLARARVRTVAADPRDPDGPGPFQTRLWPVAEVARREGAWLAVNGDFFTAPLRETLLGEGRWLHGNPARVIGWGVTDGRTWGTPAEDRPTLWLGGGRADIDDDRPAWARQAASGSTVLLVDGRPTAPVGGRREPRTAAGLTADGRTLLILVADGRRPGHSVGLTLEETAALLRDAGATEALNLDGGGSTTLVGPSRHPINTPSDGSTLTPPLSIPRPVANTVVILAR